MVFSMTGVSVNRSMRLPIQPTAMPMATPTTTAKAKRPNTSATVNAEPTAAMANWYAVERGGVVHHPLAAEDGHQVAR